MRFGWKIFCCVKTPSVQNNEKYSRAVKSPPWHMKLGITRWKVELLYPYPFSPVHKARKFSQVLGVTSERSWKVIKCAWGNRFASHSSYLSLNAKLLETINLNFHNLPNCNNNDRDTLANDHQYRHQYSHADRKRWKFPQIFSFFKRPTLYRFLAL